MKVFYNKLKTRNRLARFASYFDEMPSVLQVLLPIVG